MKRIVRSLAPLCLLAAFGAAQAELQGRNLGGDAQPEAYYDTDTGLTWLADAGATVQRASWQEAMNWATTLDVFGVTGWRLPNSQFILRQNGYGHIADTNELHVLWSTTLGNLEFDILNKGPFKNLPDFDGGDFGPYWTAADTPEDDPAGDDYALHYVLFDQFAGAHLKSESDLYAWAVKSGDVRPAVPEPATTALMLAGLAGVAALRWRRRRA